MFTPAVLAFVSFVGGLLVLCGVTLGFVLLIVGGMILPFQLLRRFRQRRLAAAADYSFEDLIEAEPLPGDRGREPGHPEHTHYPNGMEYRDPDDADL